MQYSETSIGQNFCKPEPIEVLRVFLKDIESKGLASAKPNKVIIDELSVDLADLKRKEKNEYVFAFPKLESYLEAKNNQEVVGLLREIYRIYLPNFEPITSLEVCIVKDRGIEINQNELSYESVHELLERCLEIGLLSPILKACYYRFAENLENKGDLLAASKVYKAVAEMLPQDYRHALASIRFAICELQNAEHVPDVHPRQYFSLPSVIDSENHLQNALYLLHNQDWPNSIMTREIYCNKLEAIATVADLFIRKKGDSENCYSLDYAERFLDQLNQEIELNNHQLCKSSVLAKRVVILASLGMSEEVTSALCDGLNVTKDSDNDLLSWVDATYRVLLLALNNFDSIDFSSRQLKKISEHLNFDQDRDLTIVNLADHALSMSQNLIKKIYGKHSIPNRQNLKDRANLLNLQDENELAQTVELQLEGICSEQLNVYIGVPLKLQTSQWLQSSFSIIEKKALRLFIETQNNFDLNNYLDEIKSYIKHTIFNLISKKISRDDHWHVDIFAFEIDPKVVPKSNKHPNGYILNVQALVAIEDLEKRLWVYGIDNKNNSNNLIIANDPVVNRVTLQLDILSSSIIAGTCRLSENYYSREAYNNFLQRLARQNSIDNLFRIFPKANILSKLRSALIRDSATHPELASALMKSIQVQGKTRKLIVNLIDNTIDLDIVFSTKEKSFNCSSRISLGDMNNLEVKIQKVRALSNSSVK
jgi:hypothetical protein